jgi:hypothetical protein
VSNHNVRVGVGTRFLYQGAVMEVVELRTSPKGLEAVLRGIGHQGVATTVSIGELLSSDNTRIIADDLRSAADDSEEAASVILAELRPDERDAALARAAHVREVLTGYRSGSAELSQTDEPRAKYCLDLPLTSRYITKAAELDVSLRTIKQWVADYRRPW